MMATKIRKKKGGEKPMTFNSGWCFAIVNGKLAEIFFDKKFGIYGHCYVKLEEYNKREQRMIDADIKKYHFTYRNCYYYDQIRNIKQKKSAIEEVFPEIKKYRKKK